MADRSTQNNDSMSVSASKQEWREQRQTKYPKMPDKTPQPDATAFVEQFFRGDDWEERAKHLHHPAFEDAMNATVCNTPLDEIELYRFASCTGFADSESAALSRLLCLSLDNWIQTLAGTPFPHPDIERYVEAVAGRIRWHNPRRKTTALLADQRERNTYAMGSEQVTMLRAYLNTTCPLEGIGELWRNTFPSYFKESRWAFETVFLHQMLHRRPHRHWNLNMDTRRCLCLCGYEYIKRLPPEAFNWDEPTEACIISRTVMRTAIEESIFAMPEQAAPFGEALMAYLFLEDYDNLYLLMYTNPDYWNQPIAQDPARDVAFRNVLAECMHRILVDKVTPFPTQRMDSVRNKIGTLSTFLQALQKETP